eukprot:86251-Amphidinium_carterae.1
MPACPRCRPSLLQAVPPPSPFPLVARPISDNYPSWENVFMHPGSTRKHTGCQPELGTRPYLENPNDPVN